MSKLLTHPKKLELLEPQLELAKKLILDIGLTVKAEDLDRPWGGFYAFEDGDAEAFIQSFFPDHSFDSYEDLSPKFLFVLPNMRLSWQYHFKRAEFWRVVDGPIGVKLSDSDDEPEDIRSLEAGDTIQFDSQKRHRLIGLQANSGLVAEIWQHLDPLSPSDEGDIIRVQDDFGR